jgi:hypothetical protein
VPHSVCRLSIASLLLASAASLAQPPAQTVDTLADMLKAAPAADTALFTVKGYRRPDDGGGGLFMYQKLNTRPADGGTVLEAQGVPGRFVRQFDPEGDAYAEWFGAYGDGDSANPHDDHDAINACLASLGRVKLLAKIYGVRGKPTPYNPQATYNAIDLGLRYRIEGSGRDKTTIKLLTGTNPCGSGPSENYFNVLGNRGFYESADYAVIRDVTIDCNFDGQDKHTTINAIGVRGGGVLVERCNFRGYGTGRHPEGSSRECFVIHQSLVYKDATGCRQAATYRDLLFSDPGHNGGIEGTVGEITHIALGGAHNFEDYGWIVPKGKDSDFDPAEGGENENNWWPSYGGLVENCVIRDEVYTPGAQNSFLHGITYGDCIGLTVRNNRIENFEGVAVYVMSWWNRDTTIVDNQFVNVTMGVSLEAKGDNNAPLQMPSHTNVLFARNKITLAHPLHDPWGPKGIGLFGGAPGGGPRFDHVTIRDNSIAGTAYTNAKGQRVCPVGINVQVLHVQCRAVVIENNRIDIPDVCEGVWVPQEPYAMSLIYSPLARWESETRDGNIAYRNNTNPQGKELYPILADWYYKNPPTWGKP